MSTIKILKNLYQQEQLGEVDESILKISGKPDPLIRTPFRMAESLAAIVAAQGLMISKLWEMKTGSKQTVQVDTQEAAVNLTSFLHQRQNGHPIPFSEPSYPTVGFYQAKDGRWVFLNGGYPHLRNIILTTLDAANNSEAIKKSVAQWNSFELEEKVAGLDGCVDVMRSREEWLEHPQGKFLAQNPAIVIKKIDDAPKTHIHEGGTRPLSGVRVLDLTHVIAGPTASRCFAEHGADVLHITGPTLPSIFPFVIDTGHGKRNAHLDLHHQEDNDHLKKLIKEADVFVQGYQPGKIKDFGFSAEEVAALRPGIIYVTLSCFGDGGPWGHRPGFEQLGQTASGMADMYSKFAKLETPSLVPAFPCDYVTGYLAALGAFAAMIRRATEGGSYHVHISLTRSAMFIMEQDACTPDEKIPNWPDQSVVDPYLIESSGPYGIIRHLRPMLQLSETPAYWELPPAPFGSHKAEWMQRPHKHTPHHTHYKDSNAHLAIGFKF
jgi:crotonobetainyl-CoA:carnitine CoA-transferase CaiB-like acyl-CoA transferase